MISVRDFGKGIPPTDQTKIFDRFERATPVNEVSGLGLGLYICRQIVEAHRGKIELSSEVGKGSLFKVILPEDPTQIPT